MTTDNQFDVRVLTYNIDQREKQPRKTVIVEAGNLGVECVTPPAGPVHAFNRQRWQRRVEVYISPTGRSVRVWVDGKEVKK